jgi:hypothetical protein
MTLTIELNPEEEARLREAARRHGLDAATLARQFVTERLPDINGVNVGGDNVHGDSTGATSAQEKVRAFLRQWQAQDNTPVVAAGPEPLPGETATEALFRKWNEEDARMTEAEREAEDRLWREVEHGLAENRGLRLRRAGA